MIKIPFKDLRKEILGVNDQIVTDNMLNQFLNYVPTSEEVASLEPYKDTPEQLQIADRFFLMVSPPILILSVNATDLIPPFSAQASSIPQYHVRLKCMMFRKNCQNRINEIKPVSTFFSSLFFFLSLH